MFYWFLLALLVFSIALAFMVKETCEAKDWERKHLAEFLFWGYVIGFIAMGVIVECGYDAPYTTLQKRLVTYNYAVFITNEKLQPELKLIAELTLEERQRYAPWSNLPVGPKTVPHGPAEKVECLPKVEASSDL